MEEENKGLKDEIRLLRKTIESGEIVEKKEKKPKPFKIPWKAKVGKTQSKKNYATVMNILENGDVNFTREQIDGQTIIVDGVPRLATGDVILRYKNKPLIVLPNWSVKPFSLADNYAEVEKQNMNIRGYKILLNKMKQEAISAKKKFAMGVGMWIILGLVIIGAGYYFFFMKKK